VVQSESLGAVRLGLQSSLVKLGHLPTIIQTDNSSAATRRLRRDETAPDGAERPYTDEYLHILDHYGVQPQSIHIGASNENGDTSTGSEQV